LGELLPEYDVVIVTDYGHGMIGPGAVRLLCEDAKFLAVNTQVNAHNQGFNTVSKYSRCDYLCLSETEIRMEVRNRHVDLDDIVRHVSEKLKCRAALITRGRQGNVVYGEGEGIFPIAAFTDRIVDRVGAGDAVLAVTSLAVKLGASMELAGFIGNIVGASAVGVVANRAVLKREQFLKHLISLLK
jgi:bifunctional ADP-heptose synthase (sugar kinase/adenylyltransferase)